MGLEVVFVHGLSVDPPLLATYSNLENHPHLIRARQVKAAPKIQLDPKSGLPVVQEEEQVRRAASEDAKAVRGEHFLLSPNGLPFNLYFSTDDRLACEE